ncbi:hypothetical protein BC936DRAFT_138984 [Jimgerdemannia flammicorona]|uniref:Fucosyltransferase n=1 Tax=Jimgerdemannia flammicorona TaxID=994334 RepID=A0A433BBB1_9FUNG|nr:hypothetical protein BC936DRAFT_138984 [Jimgerdemannia flammicorona]
MTFDRSKLSDATVVVFHAPDFKSSDLPPKPADKTQPWILNTAESPVNDPWQLDPKKIALFQYSMTYRLDSSFPVGYFSPGIVTDILTPPRVPLSQKSKGAYVAWVVSNCRAKNGRHYYVRELMRYIDVDVYGNGRCVPHKDWPKLHDGKDAHLHDVVAGYKFYLALENSNCQDYVSEKFETALQAGVVPIVDGPADYTPFSPTADAVIRLDDFDSPRDLATYLIKLNADDDLYNKHLAYRFPVGDSRHQDLSPKFLKFWNHTNDNPGTTGWNYEQHGGRCKLCKFAHDVQTGIVKAADVEARALVPDDTCVMRKHMKWKKVFGVRTEPFVQAMPNTLLIVIACTLLVLLSRRWVRRGIAQCWGRQTVRKSSV